MALLCVMECLWCAGVRVGSGTAMCDGVSVVCRGEGGEWHCYVRWGVCGVQGVRAGSGTAM